MIDKYLQSLMQLSKACGSDIYVVGGTLRDRLLKKKCSDFDFAVSGASTLARKYSRDISSTIVPLATTPGREIFRVVIRNNFYFDFCELQGGSIETDLSLRDFTFNAMAVPLHAFINGTERFIDPHNGKADIKNKTIRMLQGPVFSNDPLRMLRAFRFMSTIKFQIEEYTYKQINALKEKINEVAPERIYSELNYLLNSKKASPSISAMHDSGLLKCLFPALYKNTNTPPSIRVVAFMETLLSNPKTTGAKPLADIKKLFQRKRGLIKLGAILYPLKKTIPDIATGRQRKWSRNSKLGIVLTDLRASNADIDFIIAMVSCWRSASVSKLDFAGCMPNMHLLYQFIHHNEKGLIPGLFLHLANRSKLPKGEKWKTDATSIAVGNSLDFYFHVYLPAKLNKPLLDGNDIKQQFNIIPDSLFKIILDKVEEAQILRIIKTRTEAIHFAKGILDSHRKENS